MAMAATQPDRTSPGREKQRPIPARPLPPTEPPGLVRMLLQPRIVANLVASFPKEWYELQSCEFRVGIARGVMVNNPEALRRILVSDAEHFPKDDNQLAVLKPLLGNGLLTAEGPIWRRNRKIAAPIFQHSAIRDFAPLFVRAAERAATRALSTNDGTVLIDDEMTRLTLEIIGESILSADLDDDIEGISHTVASTLDKFPSMFLAAAFLPPVLRNHAIDSIVRPGRRKLDIFARKIIDEARKDNKGNNTLLRKFMAASQNEDGHEMTIEQVRDEVTTFLLAGHETTATTMAWVWYLLTLYPEWQTRLYEEVTAATGGRSVSIDDVPQLPLTRAVIDEALRLYPPVSNMMRRATQDMELTPDCRVRKGDTVLVSPWLLHRHRDHWRNPDHFDPLRFTGKEAEGRHRYTYLPFGGGPRICIGASFATLEAVLILSTFVQRMRVEIHNVETIMPHARIVLRPNRAMRATVTARRSNPRPASANNIDRQNTTTLDQPV